MKKKILIILFTCILIGILTAEGLDKWGTTIHNQVPNAYAVIKEAAIAKWEGNHTMILFEINQQSKAAIASVNTIIAFIKTTSGNTTAVIGSKEFNIFKAAVDKWSFPGKSHQNMLILDDWMYGGDIFPVYAMYVNWTMVEFEYVNQTKALNSY